MMNLCYDLIVVWNAYAIQDVEEELRIKRKKRKWKVNVHPQEKKFIQQSPYTEN